MRLTTVFAAVLVLAAVGLAEDKESILERIGDLGKAVPASQKAVQTKPATAFGSAIRILLAKDVVIQLRSFKDYGELPADFSGAENISISISAPTSNLTGTTIVAAWAAPDEFFVATDTIRGTALAFPVQSGGGGRVPV